jgi:dolichyl-phosphate-mannose-protein mannosyltransferase
MPVWEGFDEPYHLAYVTFVARHGRPPAFDEPSLPVEYARLTPLLPSWLPHAPSFDRWRRERPEWRAASRVQAMRVGSGLSGPAQYIRINYERQHPPLFYYVAAPFAWLMRAASLPSFIVGVRLFCVLVASFLVPLTAGLGRLLLPRRGLFFALPLAALLPNTLFFADRITNDALAWPILAAAAGQLVLAARRPSRPRFLVLGIFVAAGAWTKMTLLPLLPAAIVAALLARRRPGGRRAEYLIAAGALPAALIAPLLLWNTAASGVWSGITYNILPLHPGLSAVLAQWRALDVRFVVSQWTRMHLWAGGWEFLRPAAEVYRGALVSLLVLGFAGLLAARWRGAKPPGRSRWFPLACLAVFFVGAMVFHVLSAAAAGVLVGKPPLAGSEGWYFDLLRPIEACAAAALLCAAIPACRTALATGLLLGLLVLADAAGTLGLLLPHWAGQPSADWSPIALGRVVSGSWRAAPWLYPPPLAIALGAVFLAACVRLVTLAREAPTTGA